MEGKNLKKTKGSLSLEAVISFTVFLSFMFMLLMMVKLSLVAITLDTVAAETAKEIATSAYPIGLFNNMSEDVHTKIEKYEDITGFTDAYIDAKEKSIVGHITALTEKDGTKAENGGKTALLSIALDYSFNKIGDVLMEKGAQLIGEEGNKLVRNNICDAINEFHTGIDLEKLKLAVCKFPMPEQTYNSGCNSEGYSVIGITKDDFGKDDVVIGLTYDYELALPFLPTINVKLKSVAVEHAWLSGGNADSISFKEGINVNDLLFGKSFYQGAGGTSKCYHKQTCITLWKGAVPISKGEAKNLKECQVCKPGKIYSSNKSKK